MSRPSVYPLVAEQSGSSEKVGNIGARYRIGSSLLVIDVLNFEDYHQLSLSVRADNIIILKLRDKEF